MGSKFLLVKNKVKKFKKTLKVDGDKSISIRWLLLASQAVGVSKAKNLLRSDLEKFNQIKLYNEIEIPLLKTLAKMEIEGINLDVKFLKKL